MYEYIAHRKANGGYRIDRLLNCKVNGGKVKRSVL
jgi:hypothetical protein